MYFTINVWFYTAYERLCGYEHLFGKKYKNRNKLIQSGTLGQHTKNRDCPGKIRTVGNQKPVTLTQNDSITSQKTSLFICMQKINFIFQLFLTILHFKESGLAGTILAAHNSRPKILPDVFVKYK